MGIRVARAVTRTRMDGDYRVVQQDFTPEMEGFNMMFERCYRKRSLKQHIIEYFNFRSKIQLDYSCTGKVNKVGPRLHELAARGSQDVGPRNLGPTLYIL